MEEIGVGILSFVIYALYVQYSPNMGNVWIRKDDKGNQVFVPRNLFNLMVHPLTNTSLWNHNTWSINWVFFICLSFSIYWIYKNIYYISH